MEPFSKIANSPKWDFPYEWDKFTEIQQFHLKNSAIMLTGVAKPESNLAKSIMENSKKAALHAEDVEKVASKEAKAGMKLEYNIDGLLR